MDAIADQPQGSIFFGASSQGSLTDPNRKLLEQRFQMLLMLIALMRTLNPLLAECCRRSFAGRYVDSFTSNFPGFQQDA